MQKIIKHEFVEVDVAIGTTATRFVLPTLNNLRQVNLWGVQAYYKKIVHASPISQKLLIEKPVFITGFLTLVNYAGMEFLKQAPLSMFQTIENGMSGSIGGTLLNPILLDEATIQEKNFKQFAGQIVNFDKSYIEVSTPVPPQFFAQVFGLSIFYSDPAELISNPNGTGFRDKK